MPLTALAAQRLEEHLGGPVAPYEWHGGLPLALHLGGAERVHLVLKTRRFFGPIWDVIATMQGSKRPEQTVVVGGHRDAWTYGAVDPISGTVDLLQVGEAFGRLGEPAGGRTARS